MIATKFILILSLFSVGSSTQPVAITSVPASPVTQAALRLAITGSRTSRATTIAALPFV
ncbi:hypothetical protein [Xanthomonas phage JGB6]|nr:hypothetical protein [Xanthomonas phage JGB6]